METQVNEIRLYSANGKLKHTLYSTWGTMYPPNYKGKEVFIDGNNGITYKVLVNDIVQWPQRHNMLYKIYAKQITVINS